MDGSDVSRVSSIDEKLKYHISMQVILLMMVCPQMNTQR